MIKNKVSFRQYLDNKALAILVRYINTRLQLLCINNYPIGTLL